MKKKIVIALVGNPNSGKTSLFNELVGSNQKVGNWAGVTIEKYEGSLEYKGYTIKVVDLPGTYSLTTYTPEELIARNYITEANPDVVVDVIDGSNLERNLYLTLQLMELETNIIVALNMYDEIEKQNIQINIKQLQQILGSHVIPTSATKNKGLHSLLDHVIRVYEADIVIAKNKLYFREEIEESLQKIKEIILKQPNIEGCASWLAIKLLENDEMIYQKLNKLPVWLRIEPLLKATIQEIELKYQTDPEVAITEDRNAFIRGAMEETVKFNRVIKKSLTDRIDSILINRILGLPVFFIIMWLVFQFTFVMGKIPMHWIASSVTVFSTWIRALLPSEILKSIIVDGIIAGVGGVIIFLPNIVLLFIALSFLEGTGYMARAAFVVDKIMHKVGLHGKSFIPLITGFGCSIPAIMATRTLKNRGDRVVTMLIIPFMSCGAKLPVYILLIGAFFPPEMAGSILFGVYVFGVVLGLIMAKILKSVMFKNQSEPFVMELPPYRMPTLRYILLQAKAKAYMYLRKAGSIILIASLIIWVASNYPRDYKSENLINSEISKIHSSQTLTEEESEKIKWLENKVLAQRTKESFAGRLGSMIEPAIKPLGFDWRIGMSLIAGVAGKELVVSTLGTIFSLEEPKGKPFNLANLIKNDKGFNRAKALSLMVFVLLYIPCLAATAIFKKETSWKMTGFFAVYTVSTAWLASFIVYNIANLLFT